MTTLIVPAAGLSTRYGLSRPKYLLHHPSGRTMISEGLSRLNLENVDRAVIVCLAEHFEGLDPSKLEKEIKQTTGLESKILLLDRRTPSMVATICVGISELTSDEPIIVKDTDNLICADIPTGENFVVFANAYSFPDVTLANKSFVEMDSNGYLSSFVEKRIISESFNTGLIGFKNASDFLSESSSNSEATTEYVSSVVEGLVDNGELFECIPAETYIDWGTLSDWRRHISQFATYFVDIDGVISENINPLSRGAGWQEIRPIQSNVDSLKARQKNGNVKLVFTTARGEENRGQVLSALEDLGFVDFELVMSLPHSQRIIINDFAPTNPYPSAQAINLERNSSNLEVFLGQEYKYF